MSHMKLILFKGYEVMSATISRKNEHGVWMKYNTTFEHFKEKEFLIIENLNGEFQTSDSHFDILIQVQFKSWLNQVNTSYNTDDYTVLY